ncbi:MAG: carbohydrate kinase family protein, partial [Bacteroidota bacterium]
TTLVLVTKSQAVSDFEAYRMADRQISAEQLAGVTEARIVHTTAFALSREPARSVILAACRQAAAAGRQVSTDFNYADKIWGGQRGEGLEVLQQLCALEAFVKVSEVDYARLFQEEATEPRAAANRLRALGAKLVCLTLGEEGCYVLGMGADFHLPARPVEVKDTTGAGDAFWAGFLSAYLAGYGWEDCARAGRGLAERKLRVIGPLYGAIELSALVTA